MKNDYISDNDDVSSKAEHKQFHDEALANAATYGFTPEDVSIINSPRHGAGG